MRYRGVVPVVEFPALRYQAGAEAIAQVASLGHCNSRIACLGVRREVSHQRCWEEFIRDNHPASISCFSGRDFRTIHHKMSYLVGQRGNLKK